jgi:ubiquinone/menaquinone biosynthesis C-methylase UbiE
MPAANTNTAESSEFALLRGVRKAIQIWRTAPSCREGFRAIVMKTSMRFSRVEKRRESRRQFWQEDSTFEFFTSNSNAATQPGAAYMDKVINDFFLARCRPGDRVLDMGCGHGIVSIALARHGCEVTACDVSERMLKGLAENAGSLNIKTQQADAYHLPFKGGEFDRVVARMFLLHFADWPKVLREMARCCRPGGQLLLHVTTKENADLARESSPYCFPLPDLPQPEKHGPRSIYYGEFDAKRINKAAKRAGLRVIERKPCMFFHNNPLISFAVGPDRVEQYREELKQYLARPDVLQFVHWFERTAVDQMPFWISYYNILVLEKL